MECVLAHDPTVNVLMHPREPYKRLAPDGGEGRDVERGGTAKLPFLTLATAMRSLEGC